MNVGGSLPAGLGSEKRVVPMAAVVESAVCGVRCGSNNLRRAVVFCCVVTKGCCVGGRFVWSLKAPNSKQTGTRIKKISFLFFAFHFFDPLVPLFILTNNIEKNN